jgi:formylglycine-generating enzyme required for sulfatase activity
MGSTDEDPDAQNVEKPQHTVTLADYRIGRYPVTNAEYQAFAEDARHPAPRDWENDTYPRDKGDHPVVYISWHDALAYCQWLSQKSGKRYHLPSEAEWEKAARGEDGRIYPWGDDWDAEKVNSVEGGSKTTTPVGQYSPAGDSPYGIADMAGNVWEWTRSLWGKKLDEPEFGYPYDPEDSGREDLKAGDEVLRVLRGGAFGNGRRGVRCAVRLGNLPVGRSHGLGFRVVLSPFSSDL